MVYYRSCSQLDDIDVREGPLSVIAWLQDEPLHPIETVELFRFVQHQRKVEGSTLLTWPGASEPFTGEDSNMLGEIELPLENDLLVNQPEVADDISSPGKRFGSEYIIDWFIMTEVRGECSLAGPVLTIALIRTCTILTECLYQFI